MRTRVTVEIALGLSATLWLLTSGCTPAPVAPDSEYRQALENAVYTGECTGPAVDRLRSAYQRWHAIGSTIAGHDRTDEAAALLRQGTLFTTLECPGLARESYEAVLARYPEPDLAIIREQAAAALRTLPAPAAESGGATPTPVAPASTSAPVTLHP